MKLNKILLNGFKSFADKTELTFDSQITAIVGPNGCGKSNIVDAVKWVLGEQSVKSLRGGLMADVIFSGSSSRKPLGTAEVTLFFTNTTGKLPIDTDEVQISRRIYKTGECDYRINNKICRLKDVRELFMDTGVGAKAYSIIEQGQIEQLLNSSKNDRRTIFEEAAGISKYKAHKKEALRKLERTDQNLLRLADILGEVQKQLRSVKLQAGKARNYLTYNQRLKELQVNYSLSEFHKIIASKQQKNLDLQKVQEKFAAVVADVARYDTQMTSMRNDIIEIENQINQADNSLVTVQSKIDQQLQKIEFLRIRINEFEQRKNAAVQRIGKLREQKTIFENDLAEYKQDQLICQKTLEENTQQAENLKNEIQQINSQCATLQADLDDEKSGIIDIVRRTAQLHNEVQSMTVFRDNLSNQKDRLTNRADIAKAELEKLLTQKAQNKTRLDDTEKVLQQLQQNLDSQRDKDENITAVIENDNKQLTQYKEKLSAFNSELSVLEDMENRQQGLNNAVKAILLSKTNDEKFSYVEGILADIIHADVKYATAIEAALEGKTDALVVNDTAKLVSDIETIKNLDGRVNFIGIDNVLPFVSNTDLSKFENIHGRLAEYVSYDCKYAPLIWKLLGKTIVVDSLSSAANLYEKLGKDYDYVTLKGTIFKSEGTIKVGRLGKATGLISRKSRLNQLKESIENTLAQTAHLQEQVTKNTHSKEHLSKLRKELRTAVYEANTEKMQLNSMLTAIEDSIKRLTDEQPLIASEINLLEQQIAQSVKNEYDSKQKLQELEEVNTQRTKHIEHLEKKYSEQNKLLQNKISNLTELKVTLGQAAEKNKASIHKIESIQIQFQQNLSDDDDTKKEIQHCNEHASQSNREILKAEANVSDLFVEKESDQQNSSHLHRKIEKLFEEQNKVEQLTRQKRAEQTEIDQKINNFRIELSQLEVKQQALTERVSEELQLDLEVSYENYKDENIDWDAVRNEINDLRARIQRLGNVNLDAIDEQEDLEKRYKFLTNQIEDLNKSQTQLQQLINRLNKQSRKKFSETFEQIRGHFQQLFRKLFGGGKADILLEDAEDILEAGIEIMAKPPGKETRSISLLSGGEKTLTAIALLFAVFKTKPSPFCLLDEVDAALDEANNERFNLLINDFQKTSQFIIITHSKRTMTIAEQLYGITMQTPGISKKISVRFDGFLEDSKNAAVA